MSYKELIYDKVQDKLDIMTAETGSYERDLAKDIIKLIKEL